MTKQAKTVPTAKKATAKKATAPTPAQVVAATEKTAKVDGETGVINFDKYAHTTQAIVPVFKEVTDRMTNDYMSRSKLFKYVRGSVKEVQEILDHIQLTKGFVRGDLMHEIINNGNFKFLLWFQTPKEADRPKLTLKSFMGVLRRAAQTKYRMDTLLEASEKTPCYQLFDDAAKQILKEKKAAK